MAENPLYPMIGSPMSLKELKRGVSGRGPLQSFLRNFAYPDQVFFFDDFLGDTINLDNYALAKGGGTADASFAIAVARGGTIANDTGTDDNNYTSLIMPLNWYGDANAGMEVRLKFNAVTSLNFEVGFADAAQATGVVNDEDTPTGSGSDFAVVSMDTDETLKTLGFYTDGSTTGQGIKATTLAGVPGLTGGTTPVANTYLTVRVQLAGNSAFCWVNGKRVASHDDDPEGNVEGGVALAPWIYVRCRAGAAARIATVDYIAAWQDR